VTPVYVIELALAGVALLLCLWALLDEIERAVRIAELYPPRHSWESTQEETTRLDGAPTAMLVALDKDQAVWRIPE